VRRENREETTQGDQTRRAEERRRGETKESRGDHTTRRAEESTPRVASQTLRSARGNVGEGDLGHDIGGDKSHRGRRRLS
jgi:hypothetical protein